MQFSIIWCGILLGRPVERYCKTFESPFMFNAFSVYSRSSTLIRGCRAGELYTRKNHIIDQITPTTPAQNMFSFLVTVLVKVYSQFLSLNIIKLAGNQYINVRQKVDQRVGQLTHVTNNYSQTEMKLKQKNR